MNQILSQDEINALLRGLSEGNIESDENPDDVPEGVRRFDIASQERIIRGRMPTMELIHDRFTRSFRSSLSKFLGKACYVNVGSIDIVKFGLFMKKLPLPSSLHIYRMPPLTGYALLVVSTPLVFAVVDTLFGGKGRGRVKIEGREYTPIETRLIAKVVMIALEVLKEAWAPIHPVDFVYVRSEFNPLAIAIVPPTDVVIIVTIEVELEQESTTLTLCTPYSTIEPIRQKLTTGMQNTRLELSNDAIERMEGNVLSTKVNMSVELARGEIKTRDIINLQIGDVIPLQTPPHEPSIVRVEGIPKFLGYVGNFQGSKAIKLVQHIAEPTDETEEHSYQ